MDRFKRRDHVKRIENIVKKGIYEIDTFALHLIGWYAYAGIYF